MYRIDYPKWKTALDAVLADREAYPERLKLLSSDLPDRWQKFVEAGGWRSHSEELTLLYSIRAHARGRVHRSRARLNHCDWSKLNVGAVIPYERFAEASGSLVLDLDLENQTKYIGDKWKEYEKDSVVSETDVAEGAQVRSALHE